MRVAAGSYPYSKAGEHRLVCPQVLASHSVPSSWPNPISSQITSVQFGASDYHFACLVLLSSLDIPIAHGSFKPTRSRQAVLHRFSDPPFLLVFLTTAFNHQVPTRRLTYAGRQNLPSTN